MKRRAEKVASAIRDELAMMIMRELSDPRLTGLPSITRVVVLDDMSSADVFVTVMGTPGQQTAALNALKHSAGLMRAKLTKLMSMRSIPFLQFKFDEDLKKELALLEVLNQVARENAEIDAKRAALEPATGEGAAPADDSPAAAEGVEETGKKD